MSPFGPVAPITPDAEPPIGIVVPLIVIPAFTKRTNLSNLFESFGLPLIEAKQVGLPVLGSELDYVRDILNPEQSFDPNSPVSIARAVKRHLGMNVTPVHLLDAQEFLLRLLERDN